MIDSAEPHPGRVVARLLTAADVATLREMLGVFASAFEDDETYLGQQPRDAYLRGLLADPSFVAIAGLVGDRVVGGLAGYVLRKFEQERSEIYLYDLAVLDGFRRRGVAMAMIDELRRVARDRGAWVVYVQADHGDDAAIALYTRLGTREDVMHFDIEPLEGEGKPR